MDIFSVEQRVPPGARLVAALQRKPLTPGRAAFIVATFMALVTCAGRRRRLAG